MNIIVWSHWIWEVGLIFLIIGCIYINSYNCNKGFKNFWKDSGMPFVILLLSLFGSFISYMCLFAGATVREKQYNLETESGRAEVERLLNKYGSWAEIHKYYKNCWWNGTKILLAVLVVAAIVGGVILIKSLKVKGLAKKLKEIDIAIDKVNEQKRKALKPHQYEQSKEYEELDRMEDVLKEAKNNIERQAAMAEVSRGIRLIKEIQKDYEFIDVQREIDELDALNKLGW